MKPATRIMLAMYCLHHTLPLRNSHADARRIIRGWIKELRSLRNLDFTMRATS
jgi:hypothetical protein